MDIELEDISHRGTVQKKLTVALSNKDLEDLRKVGFRLMWVQGHRFMIVVKKEE